MRILYLDIDALRPDHLGCYGYHRATSPHIDALAARSMVFEQCYASDAPCLPSRTAVYSGRFGIQTGVVGHGGTAAQPKIEGAARGFEDSFGAHGLARQLQRRGLRTVMISPFGQRHAAHWIYAGFNEVQNTGQLGVESADQVWPTVERWLAAHGTSDHWYLHLNLWDAHTPYRVPESYGEPFADTPLPAWLDDEQLIARHNRLAGPHGSLEIGMYHDREDPRYPRQPGKVTDRRSMRRLIDGYDTAIRYIDDYVGRIVAFLKDRGIYEDTAIILSADHGENFGELGLYAEHATADQATCRIPLIVKWPGARAGRTARLQYNVDLAPTLLELLGGERPAIWDGESFASAFFNAGDAGGRSELILSQCSHVCQRSVRWANWLYLRTYHDGFHLFPEEMLFDLASDPHEQNDLAARRPEICHHGAWRLERWHAAQMTKMAECASDAVDPLWTVVREGGPFHARLSAPGNPGGAAGLSEYLAFLVATGRAESAAVLRAKYLSRPGS